jgi:acetyltransferase-like isoleucine patch superfamily enzyme
LRWKWRFNHFGWKSKLYTCDLLFNPKLISIGRGVLIRKGARLEAIGNADYNNKPKLIIGDGTAIQFYFHCGAAQSIKIGKDVLIAGHVYITDHDHIYNDPILPPRRCNKLESKSVVIEDGCWLGEGCKILKGVTIGRNAVVAAGSVVTKDVSAGTIVAGVPARFIKKTTNL